MKFIIACFFVFFITNVNGCELYINGKYTLSTYKQIHETLNKCYDKEVTVTVNSEGGVADKLLHAMNAISAHNNVTWIVEPNGVCMSACAWTGLAARRIKGKLYFHGVSDRKGNLTIYNFFLQLWLLERGIGLETTRRMIQSDFFMIDFDK